MKLTEGPIVKNMLLFALPMMLGNFLQQIYNIADMFIVGRFIGSDALAAVGSAYTLMTFLTSLIIGLCMGSEHYFVGIVFIFLYNFYAYLLRSVGNSIVPLYFLAVSSVLNVVLDLYFVISLKMGTPGAAIATVISQGTAGIGCLFLLYGFYRGIGRAEMSFILTVISLGTRVVLAYVFAPIIGVTAIWWAIPIGWLLADTVGLIYYKNASLSYIDRETLYSNIKS